MFKFKNVPDHKPVLPSIWRQTKLSWKWKR